MTIRFYVLPIETVDGGTKRGPKYFAWRFDPDPPGLTDQWSMLDYGLISECVLAANISDVNHAALVLNADVYSFPINLDANMPQGEQAALTTFLEGVRVPAQWLSGQQTYRSVLRTISGVFLYIQRVSAIMGVDPTTIPGVTFNTQYNKLPAALHDALAQAAADLGYSFSGVSANTTLRNLFKAMADQWGTRQILMGFVTL
jgi:hypothetical protein